MRAARRAGRVGQRSSGMAGTTLAQAAYPSASGRASGAAVGGSAVSGVAGASTSCFMQVEACVQASRSAVGRPAGRGHTHVAHAAPAEQVAAPMPETPKIKSFGYVRASHGDAVISAPAANTRIFDEDEIEARSLWFDALAWCALSACDVPLPPPPHLRPQLWH